jgi:hypothetical protein
MGVIAYQAVMTVSLQRRFSLDEKSNGACMCIDGPCGGPSAQALQPVR